MTDIPKGIEAVMLKFSSGRFFLGLLILSTTLDVNGAVSIDASTERGINNNAELADKAKMVADGTTKWSRGRKIGFGDVTVDTNPAKDRKVGANSGANNSVEKCGRGGEENLSLNCEITTTVLPPKVRFGSSTEVVNLSNGPESTSKNSKVSTKLWRMRAHSTCKLPSRSYKCPRRNRKNGKQKLVEAADEIFKMLNKDYQDKPHRRRPINN